jgi:hypothetical protein
MLAFATIFRQIGLVVQRRRLRRIAGICGRLLTLFQLQLQRLVVRLQLRHQHLRSFQLRMLGKHQIDQFVTTLLSQFVLGHRDPILSNLSQVA